MNEQINYFYTDIIIVVNSLNLYSSICDAVNLVHLFRDIFVCKNIFILSNDKNTSDTIENKIKLLNFQHEIIYIVSHNLLYELEQTIKKINNNFLFCLSSHGYALADKNYINWNGKKVTDEQFHDVLSLNMKKSLYCLSLIDTCQSGTMLNLNYQTKDLINYKPENLSNSSLNIVCIGAVDDNEYDQDDISDFGYGGGLTSAFIDFMKSNNETKTIKTFFLYYKNRVSALGHHPVLSLNFDHFL